MAEERRAAIDPDDIRNKELGQISAEEFLTVLNAGGMTVQNLSIWPEKKKVELWVGPENLGTVKAGQVIDFMSEKKKTELEPWLSPHSNFADPSPQPSSRTTQLSNILGRLEIRLSAIENRLNNPQ